MDEHLERELKLAIPDAAAFAAVRARLAAAEAALAGPVRQVNHFFDTPMRRLRAARVALRLRQEEGAWTLGLKGPARAATAGLSIRAEEELPLDPAAARAILAGERCPLATLEQGPLAGQPLVREARACVGPVGTDGSGGLVHLGSFENERTRIGPLVLAGAESAGPVVVELDRTRFPDGTVHHELELELSGGADAETVRRALERRLSGVGLAAESVPSKAARFFRILDRRE